MILGNNFISIIILGHFNPSILTRDFLENNSIVHFQEEPTNIRATALASNIEYKDVRLMMDLKLFSVFQKEIEDFTNNMILGIAYEIIDLLAYTPLKTAGINFNVSAKILEADRLAKNLSDKRQVLDFFGGRSFIINIGKKYEENREDLDSMGLQVKIDDYSSIQINIKRIKDYIYNINYNFSIGGLLERPENRDYIRNNFKNIIDKFCATNHKYFGE